MSASPDGRDQRALHPHRPRASSRADEPSNGRVDDILNGEFAATARERDEESHNDIVPAQDEQTNGGYNVADGNGADPDVKNAAPRLARSHQIDHQNIHQNTPANNRNVPVPDAAQRLSPASLARALEQHTSGNQVNGVTHADGELNRVNSTAASGSTDGSSRSHSNPHSPTRSRSRSRSPPPPPLPSLTVSQRSDSLAGANSQHPRGPGVSASQASDAGDRARQAEAPRSSSHNLGPTSNHGSQVDTGGETRSGEVYELDSSRNKSNQNTATPEYNQVLVAPQGNNSHNQQINRDISFDGASDMVDDAATSYLNTSQDGFHTQSRDPSGGLGRFTHLDTTDSTPQQSHLPDPPGPSAQASGSRPSLNPIAPSFVPRPEQPGVSQTFTLPPWQPDADVPNCPICHVQFGLFLRKHHCRKCGRVVCDKCSPHRITIPHPYIVRPPGFSGPPLQSSYPGVEGSIADFSTIGGGERVRLCNPCVPDPNTAPPRSQPQQSSQPIIVDRRASHPNPPSNSVGNYNAVARPYPHHLQLPSQGYTPRTRSVTTGAGHGPRYYSLMPYTSTSQYPPPNATYFPQPPLGQHRMSSGSIIYPSPTAHFGWTHSSSPSFPGLNRPLPRIPTLESEPESEPEIPEEDICPVCHRELPSRKLSNYETLREAHVNDCITSHSNYRRDQAAAATNSENYGTPPPRTTRRTRMFPYIATEKDCVGDVECTICLEEFRVGDEMARLECFCRFHRSCIDSWFVNHPGRCPVHQHDSFGY